MRLYNKSFGFRGTRRFGVSNVGTRNSFTPRLATTPNLTAYRPRSSTPALYKARSYSGVGKSYVGVSPPLHNRSYSSVGKSYVGGSGKFNKPLRPWRPRY